jgi:hypothetical protein
MKLRRVTLVHKNDPDAIPQYGLIAKEVERVYAELVTYNSDGNVQTVRYSMLTPMVLNELEKQARELRNQRSEIQRQAGRIDKLSARISAMKRSIDQALAPMRQRLDANDPAPRIANAALGLPMENALNR